EAVLRAIEACRARGARRAMALPVSAPFHSSLMKPAGERLAERLASVTLDAPQIPLVNNVDVKTESTPEAIRDALVRQAYSPVRWVEVINAVAAMGVTHIVECGPGKVLAGMTKRIQPQVAALALADRASLEQALQSIKGEGAGTAGKGGCRASPARRAASAAPSRSRSGQPARASSARPRRRRARPRSRRRGSRAGCSTCATRQAATRSSPGS